jgi:hypothetical protein
LISSIAEVVAFGQKIGLPYLDSRLRCRRLHACHEMDERLLAINRQN